MRSRLRAPARVAPDVDIALDRIAAVLLAKEVLEGDVFAQMVQEDMRDKQREPDCATT